MNDLVVLVADKNMEATIQGILARQKSLQIRQINAEIFVHPEKDPGCLLHSHEFLRSFRGRFAHALILFDREGCGRDNHSRVHLEIGIESEMRSSGWDDRATVIVLDPELEVWVWSDSPHVAKTLGFTDQAEMRLWLVQEGHATEARSKPSRPKDAMESALRRIKKARSSAIFHQLAQTVSLERCQDPAFLKLKETLKAWFSTSNAARREKVE